MSDSFGKNLLRKRWLNILLIVLATYLKSILEKKWLLFILMIQLTYLLSFIFLDNQAAKYGNGRFKPSYRLTDDGVYIANFSFSRQSIHKDESSFGLPSGSEEEAKPFVYSINRYALKDGQLFFDLVTDSGQYWYYADDGLLPISKRELEPLALSWVNLASKPTVYYYWKLIFLIMFLSIMGTSSYLGILMLVFFLRRKEFYKIY